MVPSVFPIRHNAGMVWGCLVLAPSVYPDAVGAAQRSIIQRGVGERALFSANGRWIFELMKRSSARSVGRCASLYNRSWRMVVAVCAFNITIFASDGYIKRTLQRRMASDKETFHRYYSDFGRIGVHISRRAIFDYQVFRHNNATMDILASNNCGQLVAGFFPYSLRYSQFRRASAIDQLL